jgi:polo-like kinase 1
MVAPVKQQNRLFQEEKSETSKGTRGPNDLVYVKKWMRTKYAVMFRLLNKIVQVNFQDHTEIILSSETKMVTYVNKKGQRKTYRLSQAIDSGDTEMYKRLKYTKDIMTQMLSANSPVQS